MKYLALLSLTAFCLYNGAAACRATAGPLAVAERRIYDVSIDNKPAGSYTLTLTQSPDGTVDVQSQAAVDYSFLFHHYKYSYKGHEVWKGEKFNALDSTTNDDGKACTVHACKQSDGMHVQTNGKDSLAPGELVSSSYWHLPLKSGEKKNVQLLEVDTGLVYTAMFNRVADEHLAILDKGEDCQHYKLTGGDKGDLWYDANQRLVRHTSTDDGHKTVIQLRAKVIQ